MRDYTVFFARLAADLLDAFFLGSVFLAVKYFLPIPDLIIRPLESAAYFTYFIYFYSTSGQTFGKKLMFIRVIDHKNRETLSLRQAFLRELLWIIPALANLTALFFPQTDLFYFQSNSFAYLILLDLSIILSILLDKNHRGLHDKIARSLVVRVPSNHSPA